MKTEVIMTLMGLLNFVKRCQTTDLILILLHLIVMEMLLIALIFLPGAALLRVML